MRHRSDSSLLLSPAGYLLIASSFVTVVMQSLEGEVSYEKFSSVVQGAGDKTDEETLGIIYTGLLSLVRCALRHSSTSLKQQVGASSSC